MCLFVFQIVCYLFPLAQTKLNVEIHVRNICKLSLTQKARPVAVASHDEASRKTCCSHAAVALSNKQFIFTPLAIYYLQFIFYYSESAIGEIAVKSPYESCSGCTLSVAYVAARSRKAVLRFYRDF